MAEELSFGELEIQADARPAVEQNTPLRIAVLGDFTGRAVRGTLNDPPPSERKPVKVTFDNVEERLEEAGLEFELPIFGGAATIEFEVAELDDFHPDILHKNIDWFDDLKDLHSDLRDGASAAIEKVRDWASDYDRDRYEHLTQSGGPSGHQVPSSTNEAPDADVEELDEDALFQLFVGHHVAACPDDADGEQLAEAVNLATADLMRAILHDPGYRALESIWRGLAWFLKRVAKVKRANVVLLDMAASELASDLRGSEDLSQTELHKMLVESVANDPDPKPWGMVIGHYEFNMNADHAELLGRFAKITAATGAACLTSLVPEVTHADFSISEELEATWQQLRSLPEAKCLNLCSSGFLLRPPIGESFRTPERLKFEEFTGSADSCLFGVPALIAGALLATGFAKSGWGLQPGAVRTLSEMPLHGFRNADDEDEQITTQTRFTSSVGQRLVALGITPVLSRRGQDVIEIANLRSVSAEEDTTLAGPWQPGEFSASPDDGPPSPSSPGVATQAAEQAKVTPYKKPDPEVDDDLAALMAAGDDDDDDDDDDDFSMGDDDDDDSDSDSDDDDDMSALLGGDDDDDDMSALLGGDDDDDDDDDDLSALLGGDDDDDEDSGDSDDDDDDLAALLAGGDDDDDDADSGDSDDDDDDLAALLAGGDDDDDDADSGDSDDDDDDLAAALGWRR